MPLLIYQNMVNLIVGFLIWRRPSIFKDFAMREHPIFDSEIFNILLQIRNWILNIS
jgi:hypothetical protein